MWTQSTKPLGPIAYAIKAGLSATRHWSDVVVVQGLETLPQVSSAIRNTHSVVRYLQCCDYSGDSPLDRTGIFRAGLGKQGAASWMRCRFSVASSISATRAVTLQAQNATGVSNV
jgi:hypothetical protein